MKAYKKLNVANGIITGTRDIITVDADGVETVTIVNTYRWEYALKLAALEIQLLNTYAGTTDFPRPVTCNPDAMIEVDDLDEAGAVIGTHWEGDITGFVGELNGLPDELEGRFEVTIENYAFMDHDKFPATPKTFFATDGIPPTAGKILS